MVIGQGHTCSVASLLEQDPARICATVIASCDTVTAVTDKNILQSAPSVCVCAIFVALMFSNVTILCRPGGSMTPTEVDTSSPMS